MPLGFVPPVKNVAGTVDVKTPPAPIVKAATLSGPVLVT